MYIAFSQVKHKQMIHFLVDLVLDHELAEALVATMNLTRVFEALTEQISDFSCEALKKKLRTMSLLELKAHAWINRIQNNIKFTPININHNLT
jgi:hypothetical protein